MVPRSVGLGGGVMGLWGLGFRFRVSGFRVWRVGFVVFCLEVRPTNQRRTRMSHVLPAILDDASVLRIEEISKPETKEREVQALCFLNQGYFMGTRFSTILGSLTYETLVPLNPRPLQPKPFTLKP